MNDHATRRHLTRTVLGSAGPVVLLWAATAGAQPAPAAPPAPAAAPAPAAPPPAAAPAAPAAAPVAVAPAPVPPPAPPPPADATPMPPPDAPPPPPKPADDMKHTPMGIHAWGRVGATLRSFRNPKKMNHVDSDGDAELHFDGNVTKEIGITANGAAVFGPNKTGGSIDGTFTVMDLIARFDIHDAFHIWGGRMLVPSDRANFSGAWFEAPWYYPGIYSPHGFIGPHEGPYGRNDGATVWGQFADGMFKYYVGAFDLYKNKGAALWTARLNLSLLNPEPGFYHSSTYYGKDILALAVGAQMQKDGSGPSDYQEINADLLFEKELSGGAFDVEGAIYGYGGRAEPFKYSWLGLVSYLTPDKIGPGKIQPLVRVQQAKAKITGKNDTSIEAQIGYPIEMYDARLALGYQHTDNSGAPGNAIYLGAQILK